MINLKLGDLVFMKYTNNEIKFVDMVEDFEVLSGCNEKVIHLHEWMLDENLNVVWVHMDAKAHVYKGTSICKDVEVVEVWRKDGDVYRQVDEDNMISGQMTTDDLDDLLAENYR